MIQKPRMRLLASAVLLDGWKKYDHNEEGRGRGGGEKAIRDEKNVFTNGPKPEWRNQTTGWLVYPVSSNFREGKKKKKRRKLVSTEHCTLIHYCTTYLHTVVSQFHSVSPPSQSLKHQRRCSGCDDVGRTYPKEANSH